jgi:hypothetical protein
MTRPGALERKKDINAHDPILKNSPTLQLPEFLPFSADSSHHWH